MLSLIFGLTLSLAGIPAEELQPVQRADTVKRSIKAPLLFDSTARFIRINRIFIIGNDVTRERIVRRELSVQEGDIVYSADLPSLLEVDRKKLVNTRLFNTVNIRTLELDKDQFDLLIDLKERWYTFPSPIFDLADRNFNEWWQNYDHDFRRVNYGLRLYRFNMRGRNETLRFVAQFGYLKRFELSYRIPYLDKGQKHGIVIDFDYSEAKNVPYQTKDNKLVYYESEDIHRITRGGGVTYTFRNSFYETHALKAEFRNNSISDSIIALNSNYLGDENKRQQYGVLTYFFTSDHRDYIAYPLRGHYFNGYISKTGLTRNDGLDKLEGFVSAAKFFELKRNYYLSTNLVGYLSTPDKLPYFNYGALGYRKQFIRGYELYVIEGPAYVMGKTTFKKRLLSRTYHWNAMPFEQFRHIPLSIYLKTYADIGYVQSYADYQKNFQEQTDYHASSRLTDKLLSGVGGGIDIIGSYDLVLRFEYTYNIEGEKGFFFHLKKEF
jgi:outer membrane protein assembly factor BamA